MLSTIMLSQFRLLLPQIKPLINCLVSFHHNLAQGNHELLRPPVLPNLGQNKVPSTTSQGCPADPRISWGAVSLFRDRVLRLPCWILFRQKHTQVSLQYGAGTWLVCARSSWFHCSACSQETCDQMRNVLSLRRQGKLRGFCMCISLSYFSSKLFF